MNLKVARQIAHLTQRELGRKAGVDPTTISLLENNRKDYHTAQYATIVHLSRALNCDPELLFPVTAAEAVPTPVAV